MKSKFAVVKVFSIYLFILVCIVVFNACTKKQISSNAGTNNTATDIITIDTNMITLKKGDKVQLDSPSKFVQIWILFLYDQKNWLDEVNKNTNSSEDPETLLAKKRREFYHNYGLTEDDFTKYSENHYDEINTFLEKNPKFKKALDDSSK